MGHAAEGIKWRVDGDLLIGVGEFRRPCAGTTVCFIVNECRYKSLDRRIRRKAHVEIIVDRFHELLQLMLEEMVRTRDFVVMDGDVLLGAQLVDQLLHSARRHHFIRRALNDYAGRRAGCKEGKVVHIGGRCDGYKAANLWPPHQQLHPDPRAEAETGDPGGLCFGMEALHPIERGGGVGQLAHAIIERALAAANAAKVEAERGKATTLERLVESLRDAVVHCAPTLRMRVQDHGYGRAGTGSWAETTFKTAFGTRENDCWHCDLTGKNEPAPSNTKLGGA